jgi:hypothetical protein
MAYSGIVARASSHGDGKMRREDPEDCRHVGVFVCPVDDCMAYFNEVDEWREHASVCSEEGEKLLAEEPQRVYHWPGHVVVAGRRGDWKCPVESCEHRETILTWEDLKSHVLTHGCAISGMNESVDSDDGGDPGSPGEPWRAGRASR